MSDQIIKWVGVRQMLTIADKGGQGGGLDMKIVHSNKT